MSFFSVPRQPVAIAFAISLGLHGAAGMWVKVRSTSQERPEASPRDVWAGRGIEIEPAELETEPFALGANESSIAGEATTPHPVEQPFGREPVCVTDCTPPEAKPEKRRTASAPDRVSAPSVASGASPSASASSGDTATATGDAFGALGLPAGVRFLPKAYTRALNQGSWRVAGFRSVVTGRLCEAHISIAVGEDRKLGALEYRDERERDALPALCRTMLENGYRLVSAGEFSLDPKRLEGGVMRLRVEVEVSDGAPADADREPNELFSESQDPPSAGKRGRSTFILNSGRRVDAFVDIE